MKKIKKILDYNSVYVVFNIKNKTKKLNIAVDKEGTYIDLLTGNKIDSKTIILTVSLERKSSLILKLVE